MFDNFCKFFNFIFVFTEKNMSKFSYKFMMFDFIRTIICQPLIMEDDMKEFDTLDIRKFAYEIYSKINSDELPVFLCVGSDKFVADSLAPIVAEMLVHKYNISGYVYGGLDYNVNGKNLSMVTHYIECSHPRSQIILIDATLSQNVGKVIVTNGSFAGLGKILPIRKLGNFSILGVVGKSGRNFQLNTTKLQLVKNLAEFISKGIAMALFAKKQYNKKVQN